MDLGLRGKGVVVTGGSRGIGRGIAHARVFAATSDVTDADALSTFLTDAHADLGRIDVLVNNVSGWGFTDDEAGWQAVLDADVMGAVRAVWKVVPWMREAGAVRPGGRLSRLLPLGDKLLAVGLHLIVNTLGYLSDTPSSANGLGSPRSLSAGRDSPSTSPRLHLKSLF